MNIHINKETYELLKKSALITLEIGSYTYGISDEYSDKDYLTIYAPFNNERNSFWNSHHQFQYKDIENNEDHNFVSIFSFLRNLISGDSTINFEFIHDEKLIGTTFQFLYDYRFCFYNYNIIRSYNGFAKRDLKHINKEITERDKNKKIIHAFRCHIFAKQILRKKFQLYISGVEKNMIDEFKNLNYKNRKSYGDWINVLLEDFRIDLNDCLNNKKISKFMKVEDQIKIDKELSKLINSNFYQSKIQEYIDLTEIYKANEFGVIY